LATIESIDESQICVQFKKINLTIALDWENVFILDLDDDSDDESSSETSSSSDEFESDTCYEANTSKNLTTEINLGDWEKHTKV